MISSIATPLTRFPTALFQPPFFWLPHFHFQRIYHRFTSTSTCQTNVALWTRRGRHQQISFCQEFNVVANIYGAWLTKVLMCILGKACAHEHIQNIMDIHFIQTVSEGLSCQIRMATSIGILVCHEIVGVGVTARSNHVMNTGTVFVKAVCDGI